MRVIFRAWVRDSFRGLVAGWFQGRCWCRAVRSVANCWLVSPVVRWCCNGLFWLAEVIWLKVYLSFLLLVGSLFYWWVWDF